MLVLKVALNQAGKMYRCLAFVKDNLSVVLTFDVMTILKVSGYTVDQLFSLAVGEYAL